MLTHTMDGAGWLVAVDLPPMGTSGSGVPVTHKNTVCFETLNLLIWDVSALECDTDTLLIVQRPCTCQLVGRRFDGLTW